MKPYFITGFLIVFLGCFLIPLGAYSGNDTARWTFGPWQTQDMVSWGSEKLVVDFGPNGLWRYDGSWIRLSLWDPEGIVVLGNSNLVVNFGSNGLWEYDGTSWEQIALWGP